MKKMIVEKETGEKYMSKAAMMKHEKNESAAERKMEYGSSKKGGKDMMFCKTGKC